MVKMRSLAFVFGLFIVVPFGALSTDADGNDDICVSLDESLNIPVSCAAYAGGKYTFTFDYVGALLWKLNLNSFGLSTGKSCLSVNSDLSIPIACAVYGSVGYGFTFRYAGDLLWELDLNTFRQNAGPTEIVQGMWMGEGGNNTLSFEVSGRQLANIFIKITNPGPGINTLQTFLGGADIDQNNQFSFTYTAQLPGVASIDVTINGTFIHNTTCDVIMNGGSLIGLRYAE